MPRRDRSDSFHLLRPTRDPSGENLSVAEHNLLHSIAPVYKIVLTGGPCGGKTTAMARLSIFLRERGFRVMTCPEAYGTLVTNGMNAGEFFPTPGMGFIVQHSVMELMIALEDSLERVLRAAGAPAVLLCDRGIMDGRAYLSEKEWEDVLRSRGDDDTDASLREGRYNAVFHLVTAAEGAEAFYTLDNNAVRTETPEEAREVDARTRSAWTGHPNLCVFGNAPGRDFEHKLGCVVNAAAKLVGLPTGLDRESARYLLREEPDLDVFPDDVDYHVFDVEKVYLYEQKASSSSSSRTPVVSQDPTPNADANSENDGKDDLSNSIHHVRRRIVNEHVFVRKRCVRGVDETGAVYGMTTVQRTSDGQEIESKRIISRREYNASLKIRDTGRHIIRQTRICFLWDLQSFNVHVYREPAEGTCILHCQLNSSDGDDSGDDGEAEMRLPPFLKVERKLTPNDTQYGGHQISIKK